MILKSVEGENINALATSAMIATLYALSAAGKLSKKDVQDFADTHVCVMAEDGIFKRIMKKLFHEKKAGAVCLIMKVVTFEDT